jgi:hypothetical protein
LCSRESSLAERASWYLFSNSQSYGFNKSSIGEICVANCEAESGQIIRIVAIYISPNQSLNKTTEFIHENSLNKKKSNHEVSNWHFSFFFASVKNNSIIIYYTSFIRHHFVARVF